MTDPLKFRDSAAVLEPLLATRPLIRTINFHHTPRSRVAGYDRQLEHCSRFFSSVTEHDLDRYLRTGSWHKSKPGLIVALYNGYRDNYDVLLPLLERYGFVGWFFVPTAWVSGPYALNWTELKELDRNHVVASHTRHHTKPATNDPAALESEIVGPQQDFVTHLGHPVRSFAFLSGVAYGQHPQADRFIEAAHYQFVFSNFQIQRLPNAQNGMTCGL